MKLLSLFIILVVVGSAASAAEISGSIVSDGKKMAGLPVGLSAITGTTQEGQSMTGANYNFAPLADAITDKDGNYVFKDLNSGDYRVNVTYNGITNGENIALQDNAAVNFNLSGKIEGFVLKTNMTMENISIRLTDMNGIEVAGAITNKKGKYSFSRVNAGKNYLVEAAYADVPYTQQVTASGSADFLVYDPTKEKDVISVNIDHIVFSGASDGIRVEEYVEFINTGDKVFFSKDRTWLGISTPKDIARFQTDVMECCLIRENDAAWIDPMKPLMPGERYSVKISYIFNPTSETVFFNKGIIYNTSYISLLSPKNNGFGLESKYGRKETVPSEGKEFEVLTFTGVPGEQIIDTRITGFVPPKKDSLNLEALVPVLAVLLLGAVSYPLIKNRFSKRPGRRPLKSAAPEQMVDIGTDGIPQAVPDKNIMEMSFDELLAERNSTFEEIMALDNRLNMGEIREKEHRELKKGYREHAMLVIRQLKDAAPNLDLAQPVTVLEKTIAHIDDIDILEELLAREIDGENRDELKEVIEQRIDDIERSE